MTTALAQPPKTRRKSPRISTRASRVSGSIEVRINAKFPTQSNHRPIRQSSEMLPQLIADHQAQVWRYLRVLGCSSDLAEDLTQETFLNAFQRPFTYRGKSAAASYLRRTAYHRYLNHLRSNQQTKELCDAEVSNVTWNRWHEARRDDDEIFAMLQECLANLPARDRLALELRFREGQSRQQIAQALSMSDHGAKNLMQRAKKKLLRAMEARLNRAA